MNLKTKINNLLEDIVIRYEIIRGNIIRYYTGLKRWFAYFKTIVHIYDFDYSSVIELEKKQITRLRDTIQKLHYHVGWQLDVEKMNLALKLLEIVEEDGCSELASDSPLLEPIEVGLYIASKENKWTLPVYVNTSNAKRFTNIDREFGVLEKDYLRTEKAWYLYNKIKYLYLKTWWT